MDKMKSRKSKILEITISRMKILTIKILTIF